MNISTFFSKWLGTLWEGGENTPAHSGIMLNKYVLHILILSANRANYFIKITGFFNGGSHYHAIRRQKSGQRFRTYDGL